MDRSQQHPWIQVIGRIAVHRPGRESHEPQGASRVLLSILVAAGPDGASIEEIAGAYWNQSRPTSWKIALRVSASHLSAQLPAGWVVTAANGQFRIVPGDGFIDVWHVAECVNDPSLEVESWLSPGRPFAGVTGVDIVDDAVRQVMPSITELRSRQAPKPLGEAPRSPNEADDDHLRLIRTLRRAIVLGPPEQHALIARAAAKDEGTETHVVIGDRRLLLPLGPFVMAFPELRNDIHLEQGEIELDSAHTAFRVLAETIAIQAAWQPQRLVLANAHELDTKSLELTSLLIDRGRLSDFSLIICADRDNSEVRWLDFINRSVTAGCELVELQA